MILSNEMKVGIREEIARAVARLEALPGVKRVAVYVNFADGQIEGTSRETPEGRTEK